ncbi:hypothetical protein FSPOR_1941 [Fusarium sporotrichioides]|uniref:Uncharacterized protein n=1 Tax=Fusarium sporotrichioides TaxID=5514 RepID=A0A395SMM9_FUSSP|nr:hypothetical protein FSPOR_1941 [Fusarium sporotrichioides]
MDSPTLDDSSQAKAERKMDFSRKYKIQSRLTTRNGALVLGRPLAHVYPPDPPTINSTSDSGPIISFFLSLPGELRLGIYRHLLVSQNLPVLYSAAPALGFRVLAEELYDPDLRLHPQILQTCKTINREATQILYADNVFRRKFYWPSSLGRRGGSRPLPLRESSPISGINLQSITKIRLFRDYRKWLRDGRLRVLDEFPSLRELQVHVDMDDARGVSLVYKDALRSIHVHHRQLSCLKFRMRLAFDQVYKDWCNEYSNRSMGFSLHLRKKAELEEWFRKEDMFAGKKMAWHFLIELSSYAGPSATIMFSTAASQSRDHADDISCCVNTDGKSTWSKLPT